MFWIELIIVLAIIFIGVRVGGTFLAMAGGIGMFIMTFILHVTPSDPPITVILIMIAVICAAATMQACGGLDYLVRIAEKILRKNPKMITVLAPVVAYIFTFMCGTVISFTVFFRLSTKLPLRQAFVRKDRFPHRSFLHSRRSQRVRFQRQQSESSLSWQRQQIIRK